MKLIESLKSHKPPSIKFMTEKILPAALSPAQVKRAKVQLMAELEDVVNEKIEAIAGDDYLIAYGPWQQEALPIPQDAPIPALPNQIVIKREVCLWLPRAE